MTEEIEKEKEEDPCDNCIFNDYYDDIEHWKQFCSIDNYMPVKDQYKDGKCQLREEFDDKSEVFNKRDKARKQFRDDLIQLIKTAIIVDDNRTIDGICNIIKYSWGDKQKTIQFFKNIVAGIKEKEE